MRLIFLLLLIANGIVSHSQTWLSDTLNSTVQRVQINLKAPGDLADSVHIKINGGVWFLKIPLSALLGGAGAVDWPDILNKPTTTSWLSNSTDKNFVTDAQATILGNTSGTNSGDNAVNSLYSGLAASKQDVDGDLTTIAGLSATNDDIIQRKSGAWINRTMAQLKTDLVLVKADVGLSNVPNTDATARANHTGTQATSTITGYQGYSINVQALTSSPADGATIYFGMLPKAPVSAAATSKVHIRKAGTITIANIYCFSGTAGSNENWSVYVRINNTTDHLIQTVGASTSERIFTNSSLSIAVVAGDYIEIKCVNPTWGTNPLTTIFGGYIYIE